MMFISFPLRILPKKYRPKPIYYQFNQPADRPTATSPMTAGSPHAFAI
jgi:hypothetical protein